MLTDSRGQEVRRGLFPLHNVWDIVVCVCVREVGGWRDTGRLDVTQKLGAGAISRLAHSWVWRLTLTVHQGLHGGGNSSHGLSM